MEFWKIGFGVFGKGLTVSLEGIYVDTQCKNHINLTYPNYLMIPAQQN